MNRYLLFCLYIFAVSCKSKQLLKPPPVIVHEDVAYYENEEPTKNLRYRSGKIINEQGEPLASVAIKFILSNEFCLHTYSDFDGAFYISYDATKITQNSYLEIVYKDCSRKIIPFEKLEKEKLNTIRLEKGDSIVTKEAYEKFYHEIRNCNW